MITTIYSHLERDPLYLREGNYIYPYNGTTCLATFRENPVDGKYSITQGFGGAYGFLYDPETGRVHVGHEMGETIFRVRNGDTEVCHGFGGYDSHLTTNEPDGIALAAAAIASMGDDRIITGQTEPRDFHEITGNHHPGLANSADSGNPDSVGYHNSVDPMVRFNDRSEREWSDDPAENMQRGQIPFGIGENEKTYQDSSEVGYTNANTYQDYPEFIGENKKAYKDEDEWTRQNTYQYGDGIKFNSIIQDGRETHAPPGEYFFAETLDAGVFIDSFLNEIGKKAEARESARALDENARKNRAQSERWRSQEAKIALIVFVISLFFLFTGSVANAVLPFLFGALSGMWLFFVWEGWRDLCTFKMKGG
jgi:hypothetical protein